MPGSVNSVGDRGPYVSPAGAGLPQLPGMIADAKMDAKRLFTYQRIDDLTEQAAAQAREVPAG